MRYGGNRLCNSMPCKTSDHDIDFLVSGPNLTVAAYKVLVMVELAEVFRQHYPIVVPFTSEKGHPFIGISSGGYIEGHGKAMFRLVETIASKQTGETGRMPFLNFLLSNFLTRPIAHALGDRTMVLDFWHQDNLQ